MNDKKTFIVFTDGGCDAISKIGASAILIIDPDIDGVIYEWSDAFNDTTNNRMELIAFKEALENLPNDCEVIFMTDSQYCITVLSGNKSEYPKNMDLIRNIRAIRSEKNISCDYHYVNAHNGNKWNEMVDSACERAIKQRKNEISPRNDSKGSLISKYGY